MKTRSLFRCGALVIVWSLAAGFPAQAQPGGGGGGQGGQGGNQNPGGIAIDANGLISESPNMRRRAVSRARLEAAARERLSEDVNRPSELRMVSLPALEAECQRRLDAGESLPDDILYLAGLQRIDYVFLLEETRDVIIAGPAGGFAANAQDVMVSVSSGRPVLRLDDLLTALRCESGEMGCSIDPVQERIAALNNYLRSAGDAASVTAAKKRYHQMAEILGQQTVRVWGVDPTSHFARVLVEADYRMKRISVGKDKPRVKGLTSYLSMKGVGTNTLRRWWFAPLYEPLERSDDGTAWRLNGQRVQVLAQEELVDASGARRSAGYKRASSEEFARNFTDKYQELARRSVIFAQLENLFDVAVATALIRREQMAEKVDWSMSLFRNPEGIPTAEFAVPRLVESIGNSRQSGRYVVVGVVAGGVVFKGREVLRTLEATPAPRLQAMLTEHARRREAKDREATESGSWWWDSAP